MAGSTSPILRPRPAEAIDYIGRNLERVVGHVDGGASGEVSTTGDLAAAVAGCWLVVEAVPERLELKKQIFGDLDRATWALRPGAASTTTAVPDPAQPGGIRCVGAGVLAALGSEGFAAEFASGADDAGVGLL
ncbi:3-hydroxyacyl-CoA dehydrogenase NAD-binding domain-containing protein [Saccharopolyspora shandongensis]|uniref:3-hydroxyacyl-CoA dehydrogenase NAD-binding domain-containing protein n=1 Tax=Saccharopolyspora shandongensis TaxID=418495 RepID=UPI0034497D4B